MHRTRSFLFRLPQRFTLNIPDSSMFGRRIFYSSTPKMFFQYKGLTATGTPVESFTSVANQSKELTLLPGEYTFHEEAAPTGYLAVTDITFRVNADGTVTVLNTNSNAVEYKDGKLVVTDQYDTTPKKVTFSKVNLGGEEIAGAQIQIFDEQQTKVEEWTSEANTSKVIDLKPGKYVFHEEAAPNGYLAVTDITFQVNYDGTVTVLDTNSNAVEYKDGKLVITDQYAPTTTTTTTTATTATTTVEPTTTTVEVPRTTGETPPPSGKKRNALPRTGEESSLMTTLIGIVLLAVVLISGSLYRKFKQS